MPRKPPRTLLDYLVAKGGIRKGMRVATFVAQWTIAQRQLEHEPSLEEAAAWWKENERSWYRRLAEFRELLPGHETPAPIAAAIIADANARSDEIGDVMGWLGRAPLEVAA